MFIFFLSPPKGEMGGGILSCQHCIWQAVPPSAKGSPGIKENLCRASSALNLKGAIWSCQLLISSERQRQQHCPSPFTAWFQRPTSFIWDVKLPILGNFPYDESMAGVLLGLLPSPPYGAVVPKGWAVSSALYLGVEGTGRKQLLHPLISSKARVTSESEKKHKMEEDVYTSFPTSIKAGHESCLTSWHHCSSPTKQQEMKVPIPLPLSSLLSPG